MHCHLLCLVQSRHRLVGEPMLKSVHHQKHLKWAHEPRCVLIIDLNRWHQDALVWTSQWRLGCQIPQDTFRSLVELIA